MTYEPFLIILAGLAAGAISSAVGSGTLVLYPALLLAGLPPVTANASNTVSSIPGNVSGAWRYRHRLDGIRRRTLVGWIVATAAGALIGASLVVLLPPTVFNAMIPWLILSAVLLFALEPWYLPRLKAGLMSRSTDQGGEPARVGIGRPATIGVAGVGVYGGYFGGGQGIAYLLVLTAIADRELQQANAIKNQMMAAANGAAAVIFIALGDVRWWAAALAGIGTVIGGWGGASIASAMPDWLLRVIVVVTGAIGFALALRA